MFTGGKGQTQTLKLKHQLEPVWGCRAGDVSVEWTICGSGCVPFSCTFDVHKTCVRAYVRSCVSARNVHGMERHVFVRRGHQLASRQQLATCEGLNAVNAEGLASASDLVGGWMRRSICRCQPLGEINATNAY